MHCIPKKACYRNIISVLVQMKTGINESFLYCNEIIFNDISSFSLPFLSFHHSFIHSSIHSIISSFRLLICSNICLQTIYLNKHRECNHISYHHPALHPLDRYLIIFFLFCWHTSKTFSLHSTFLISPSKKVEFRCQDFW